MRNERDREWNPDALRGGGEYAKHGQVSGLTVLNAEDGIRGRERWSYLRLSDELRRWSFKPDEDRRELLKRMVFNAMVTNDDDDPRNHVMLRTTAGRRLSPAYDIVRVSLISQERRDLTLEAGRFGRVASLHNLLSASEVFGLSHEKLKRLWRNWSRRGRAGATALPGTARSGVR
jgi:serine/threonine-protein kinase HipA